MRFMTALFRRSCIGFVFFWSVAQTLGFSLQGPLAVWQTHRLGYDINNPPFGGPMSIGEEYRWDVPLVYYAFSSEFLNYFGQRGVEEVEKAIKILNDLPPMS